MTAARPWLAFMATANPLPRYCHAAGHCNAQSVTRLGAADNSLFSATLQLVFSLQRNNL
jgi:hypothetical protein